MTFALTVASLCGAGLAVLGLLRLRTGRLAVDAPLAWFVGSGWFAVAAMVLRFVGRVRYSGGAAAALILAPILAEVALRIGRRSRHREPAADAASGRWLPRPLWLFGPVMAYVVFVAVVVCLHAFNTPTHTDDGVRVRAFTPMLAFDDEWGDGAKGLLAMAGAVPTFVPSLAWRLTGSLDHFHVNYVVLTDLVALLVLAIATASARCMAERGWATAFAVLSLPLFLYHCTSTYQDAVLAMYVCAGFLWTLEHGRTRSTADAGRALLVLACATMVKREGLLVASAAALPVLGQLGWDRRRGEPIRWGWVGLCCLPAVLHLAATIAAVGVTETFPFLRLAISRSGGLGSSGSAPPAPAFGQTLRAFRYALFESGNAGMVYWILPAALALRARLAARREFALPLVGVAAVFSLAAASSLWLVPAYTVDQSTVHRALLAPSVLAAVWIAALITERLAPPSVSNQERNASVERPT